MTYRLEDFIPVYPKVDDPDIQKKVSQKWEFQELETDLSEEIPTQGNPFKHQEFAARYTRISNRIFNYDETGTGKTLLFRYCVEELRRRGIIRKAYIFERSQIMR